MLHCTSCWLALSLLFVYPVNAAGPAPVLTPYERIQATRSDVDQSTGEHASPAALSAGAARLETSLRYLDQPDIDALAVGNPYLYFRGHDVRLDLARLYARLGMTDRALDTLEAAQRFFWTPDAVTGLAGDAALISLRATPRFRQILQKGAIAARLWKAPAGDVPYQENLTVAQRIAGLTTFWSEARASFVYFDHVPDLDWNQTYLDFLPKVIAAQTTRAYYDVLMQLAPLLKDGHTNIWTPPELADQFYARPPLATELVEGRVLVERVDSPALAQRVHVGDEIVAVDGVPVQRYAEQHVGPYVSSSTPQDRTVRLYSYQLLHGDAAVPVSVSLRDRAGATRAESLSRGAYTDVQHPTPFAFRMLPGGVAYLSLDQFETDAGVKAFEQALPAILAAKALVLDVRRNGGGSTDYGWEVLTYLTSTPIPYPLQYVRADDALMRARGADMMLWKPVPKDGTGTFVHPHPRLFAGKVAVLTGPRTFSAAEDFVVAFNAVKRGITVGEPTGGSTGQPLMLKLPGGGAARICIKRDLTPDGHEFVGIGLKPDVPASQTVEALRAGRDAVLERALRVLAQP